MSGFNEFNICIDFGTCNTVISYTQADNICQIPDEITGDVLIPTTIYFISEKITSNIKTSDLTYLEHYLIGSAANELYLTNKDLEYYFYQFKRFLGITSKSLDKSKEFLNKFNLEYTTDSDTIYFYLPCSDVPEIKLKLSICELIKLYFKALNQIIKTKLSLIGQINCVITCPAYFHDLQRTQLKKASEDSEFIVNKIYNEPTAAAIYYIKKFSNANSKSNHFIIYDLGGGTIDTTVVEYHESDNTCEIIDIDGNNSLGGIDIDNLIIFDIYTKYLIDPSNLKWKHKIRKIAEEIKIKLTYQQSYSVFLESVPIKKSNNSTSTIVDELKITYSRVQFNNLISNMIDQMIQPIFNMFIKYSTFNIIFIGGPTQIPLLQSKVRNYIESNNSTVTTSEDLENNWKTQPNLYKTIVSAGGSLLCKMINEKKEFYLLDIIPMNIGISGPDDSMVIMIDKNSKIPLNVEKTFTTSHDCQRSIDIEIYEGINTNCASNTFIGSYKIVGIPPLPKGMILIKLLFKISYNGILDISINGFKNPSDNSAKSFDFKMCENIKLISNMMAKDILRKLLQGKKS